MYYFNPKYGGANVSTVEIRDINIGDIIWIHDDKESEEVRRVVTQVRYNVQRQLVQLWYDGYLGEDLWGANAEVKKEKK